MLTSLQAKKLARLAKLHKINLDEIDTMHHLRIAFEEIGREFIKMKAERDES